MLGFGEGNSTNGLATNGLPTMRLAGDDPQLVTRNARKRKSPPEAVAEQSQGPPPPAPGIHHVLPPMIHPIQGHPLPPGYPYADFSPAGMPPDHHQQQPQPPAPSPNAPGRALSSSKRAEQNRKAQRAFRERRDQHVKALESRSQLLDAALASADEANRRWEECRALVDQLRIENAALRAALQQAQSLPPPPPGPQPTPAHDAGTTAAQQQLEEATRSLEAVVSDSLKSESVEASESKTERP
ncbi:hypothetical protein C0995_002164 [Termitomyces sp. Mi166|nr:hypothetical protein C0995_002164 [Termitomyces sp. Mi166\